MEQDLSEKVDSDQSDHFYRVQTDQNDRTIDYDPFSSERMKCMPIVLGDFMNLGKHAHAFCSSVQLVWGYNECVSKELESKTVWERLHKRQDLRARRAKAWSCSKFLDGDLRATLYLCDCELMTNNGRKACSSYLCDKHDHSLSAIKSVMKSVPALHGLLKWEEDCFYYRVIDEPSKQYTMRFSRRANN